MITQSKKVSNYWEEKKTVSLIDKNLRILETEFLQKNLSKKDKVLDLGCGDGESSKNLSKFVKELYCYEKSKTLFNKAKKKVKGKNVKFIHDDLKNLNDHKINVNKIITQRVIINFMSWRVQKEVMKLVYDKLPRNGEYLMIENTNQGFNDMNYMRKKLGINPVPIHSWHNKFMDYDLFLRFIDKKFKIKQVNNFNTYYLLTRVFTNTFANFSGYGVHAKKDKIFDITDEKSRLLHNLINKNLEFKTNKHGLFGPICGFVLKKI